MNTIELETVLRIDVCGNFIIGNNDCTDTSGHMDMFLK